MTNNFLMMRSPLLRISFGCLLRCHGLSAYIPRAPTPRQWAHASGGHCQRGEARRNRELTPRMRATARVQAGRRRGRAHASRRGGYCCGLNGKRGRCARVAHSASIAPGSPPVAPAGETRSLTARGEAAARPHRPQAVRQGVDLCSDVCGSKNGRRHENATYQQQCGQQDSSAGHNRQGDQPRNWQDRRRDHSRSRAVCRRAHRGLITGDSRRHRARPPHRRHTGRGCTHCDSNAERQHQAR